MTTETKAEFQPVGLQNHQNTGFAKAEVHQNAVDAGLESEEEAHAAIVNHQMTSVQAMSYTAENYGADALRRGSHENPTGLPAIIGPDAPSDPDDAHATIEEMRIARGQVLDE